MRILISAIVVMSLLLGCSAFEDASQPALDFRQQILEGEGCSFDALITADYGDKTYEFQMSCVSDAAGKIIFEVINPTSIAGITGILSQDGGALTFDDNILAFPMLTQLQLSPISAPWIFLNALRSGYIAGCGEEDDEYIIYIDDSFEEHPLVLQIRIQKNDIPCYAEIIWKEHRILTLELKNFEIL